jgi:hypothetical protein
VKEQEMKRETGAGEKRGEKKKAQRVKKRLTREDAASYNMNVPPERGGGSRE